MSITYIWKVTGVKTRVEEGQDGYVYQTYWTKTGVDELGNKGVFNGATPIMNKSDVVKYDSNGKRIVEEQPDENFIPFDQLTEEIVLGWIQERVVGDYEAHVNEQIARQIDAIVNPSSEPSLPWSQQEQN